MIFFEWDESKAASNLRKHGIDFDDASEDFYDANSLMEQDRIVDGEEQWRTIGLADESLLLYVAHTIEETPGYEIVRIISARPATRRERKRYGENRSESLG